MNSIFLNIGFGNVVAVNKIVAIVSPESAPIKRLIQDAKEEKRAVDATFGRKTRAVIVTDDNHIVLTSLQPETLTNRLL